MVAQIVFCSSWKICFFSKDRASNGKTELSLELKSKKRALYFALYSQELKAMDEELAYHQLLEISFQVRYQLHCIFVSWGARVPPPPVHNI